MPRPMLAAGAPRRGEGSPSRFDSPATGFAVAAEDVVPVEPSPRGKLKRAVVHDRLFVVLRRDVGLAVTIGVAHLVAVRVELHVHRMVLAVPPRQAYDVIAYTQLLDDLLRVRDRG